MSTPLQMLPLDTHSINPIKSPSTPSRSTSPSAGASPHHRPVFHHANTDYFHNVNGAPSTLPLYQGEKLDSDGFPQSRLSITLPNSPNRGLYSVRRVPSRFEESIIGSSSCRRWGFQSKEGSLGQAIIAGWIVTTLGFLVAIAFWKGQLFTALDQMSKTLSSMGYRGQIVFGALICVTTIPPLPLYSTLIVLSGYTFGVWHGFLASYIASLSGAVIVFVVSRLWLRDAITKCLASSATATSLLQIIPQKPHLLFLIRLAPYPYNLLNVILASAPTLSLQTYTACTALSLCKLVIHTWIGAGIRDLSSTNQNDGSAPLSAEDEHRHRVKTIMTWGGIALCVVLFGYLTHLAKSTLARAQEIQRRISDAENGLDID